MPEFAEFAGFESDSDSSNDAIVTDYWRTQMQASNLPESDDDDVTYSPSHTQIYVPEGDYRRPDTFVRKFAQLIRSSLFIF